MTALSRKFWQDYLPDRIVFLLFFLVIFVSLPQPVLHLDVPSLILVVATTLIVAEILFWASGLPFSETMMILGMPLGLVGSAIGLVLFFGTFPVVWSNSLCFLFFAVAAHRGNIWNQLQIKKLAYA